MDDIGKLVFTVALVFFILGVWAGYAMFHHPHNNDHKKEQFSRIWIDTDGGKHIIILRSIDPDRFAAIAQRISNGKPFRFAALVGRGKLLSRSEWVKLRLELVDRELMQKNRDRTLSPTPLGWQVFKTHGGTARAQMTH